MAVEVLAWPLPPADTDENDGSQSYNMGVEFSLVADTPLVGVEWRVPDTLADPPGATHAVAIWNQDTSTRLAYKTIVPTPGGVERYLFDLGDVVAGVTGTTYVACVYTNHYVFRGSSPSGVTSPSGNIVAGVGRLAPFNGGAALAPMPSDSAATTFYISPVAGEDDEEPTDVEAAGDVVLPALTLAGTIVAEATAAGDLSLPPLGLAGELSGGVTAAGALVLPALDLLGTADVEGDEPEPEESAIPGTYGRILDALRPGLRAAGLRLAAGMSDVVGRGEVVVGPPTFVWETQCTPDEPDSITFSVYLVEAVHERAIERLLVKLPALIRGIQAYRDATITGPVVPGAYPAGASDLPCYQLPVEMTL